MARRRKTETLTPEERLQVALVPKSEQPYPVPENWCWVYAPSMFNIEYGKGLPTKKLCEDGYPVFGANGQIGFYSEYMFEDEKALMSCRGAYSGTMNLSLPKSFITNNSLVIESKLADVSVKFVFYLYSALNKSNLISGSAQPQVTVQAFNNYPVPISPLPEQQRIVDYIESLFAKLDEAKQKAQDALDSFETRKAAILHKAFTGELTAQWRKEHGVGMESWKKSRFDEVATIKSNLVDPLDFPDLPHIAPDNIEKKTGVLLEYHTVSEDGVTSGKHRFYPGQILYSKIRPYLSKVVVVDFDGLCSADMYPIEAKGNAKCLWYYMLSEEFLEQASSAGSRSVLPKINQKELSALTVILPTLKDEQEEIVRILDAMFAKEQQGKESTERVLEQIDLIKKSILVRAFRGELGTNNPKEESSISLLKEIIFSAPPKKATSRSDKPVEVEIPIAIQKQLTTAVQEKVYRYVLENPLCTVAQVSVIEKNVLETVQALRELEEKSLILRNTKDDTLTVVI